MRYIHHKIEIRRKTKGLRFDGVDQVVIDSFINEIIIRTAKIVSTWQIASVVRTSVFSFIDRMSVLNLLLLCIQHTYFYIFLKNWAFTNLVDLR